MKFLVCLSIILSFFGIVSAQFDSMDEDYFRYFEAIYRKPTDKELKLLAVDSELTAKYKNFTTKNNSGIIRLMPDFGCNENKNVVVAKEECLKYSMPGGGSAYSFRKNTYRLWRLADLIYRENVFFAGSRYTQGIIGALGDVELDKISLNSKGVKQLSEFVPVDEYTEIEQQYKKIERGVIVNGILFSNKLKVKENATYILRSIAYQGKSYTTVASNIVYNEFDFDKRFDVLTAFRVLKKDTDGSVVIDLIAVEHDWFRWFGVCSG